MKNGLFVPFKPRLGRPPKFTPDELLEQFQAYLEDRKKRTIDETTTETGSTGNASIDKTTKRSRPHPISVTDFCIFLGVGESYWYDLTDEFSEVKATISAYVRDYQIKGASLGTFNANIVSRLLGLVDKTQTTSENTQRIVVENAEQKAALESIGDIEG